MDCDGVDDLMGTGLGLSEFVTVTAFTVMGWTYVANTPPSALICWRGAAITSDGSAVILLGRMDSTTFCGYAWDGGDHQVTTASSAGWHHLALKLSGGTLTLYVDGVAQASTTMGPVEVFSANVDICGGYADEPSYGDRVSEVQWFDSALSDGAIANLAQSHLRLVAPAAPTGRWPLDDCGDGASCNSVTFVDRSGNGRHATGDDGANNTGLTGQASSLLSYPIGPQ